MPASMASSVIGLGEDELDAESLDSASAPAESDEEMGEEVCESEAGISDDDLDGCSDASG